MIKNVSRASFIRDYNSNPPPNSLCISIMNTEDLLEDYFTLSSEWATRLRFTFDDISEELEGYQLFDYQRACLLLKTVLDEQLNIKSEFKDIIIHCTAGVSRSAAVALFLNQLHHKTIITDLHRFGWTCYNRHVFSLLLEAYYFMAEETGQPNYLERIR